MSLFNSKATTAGRSTQNPTNPKPVTEGIIDFTKLISSLGNRDPNQYVTGPSGLQNAAFGIGAGMAQRYGITPQQQAVRMPQAQNMQMGGGTLFGAAGMQPRQEMDYTGYLASNPDLAQHYRSNVVTPRVQEQLRSVGADYDNDGVISEQEFARYHYDAHGRGEGRQLNPIGGMQQRAPQGGVPGMVAGGDGSYRPMPTEQQMLMAGSPSAGYQTAQLNYNPMDVYGSAVGMAQQAGMANPNLAQMADLGPASGYQASPQALAAGYTAAGPAGAMGYDAATAGSRGYDARQISEAERVQMAAAQQAAARQGIEFSQPYENRFTQNVVDTTLSSMDEQAARIRAAEAAAAARNQAFGGSRFGVQRAITEENLARERALQEANLRFGAQDRAFGLGMQDAGTASQVSLANAAAANQMAQAQAQLDQQRLLANQAAANEAAQFGAQAANVADLSNQAAINQARALQAEAANRAGLDFAGRTDAASQFGSEAFNRAALEAAGRQDQASMFGANALNQFDLSRFGAANQMAQFNAGQGDQALARQLQAASLMGNLGGAMGAQERADLDMLMRLGEQERGINQQQATADLQLMQLMAQLYGQMPYNLFTGQTGTQTGTARNVPGAVDSAGKVLNLAGDIGKFFGQR